MFSVYRWRQVCSLVASSLCCFPGPGAPSLEVLLCPSPGPAQQRALTAVRGRGWNFINRSQWHRGVPAEDQPVGTGGGTGGQNATVLLLVAGCFWG